ncbi:hypothetical protein DFR52_1138 [Hoeflea marina]|uniref:Uncharacterized protein n=1 Tax=Hoeflea marina TaxID=274592 RepID=A0A317PD57_9HYPH|nr:hypothetical protein [Hoeflea marina]PWV95274.1 hypothetical protein DFR52_1138 [Hoeflea marina]
MLRAIRFLVFLLVVVALAAWISRVAAPPLPAIAATLSCDPLARQPEIGRFVAFARKHDGEIAYVQFGIQATDHAGNCALEGAAASGDGPPPTGLAPPEADSSWDRDGYGLVLSAVDNGNRVAVALPDARSMPPGRAYLNRKDWFRYYAAGLFVLRYETGNGFEGASLYPAQDSTVLAAGISCAKTRLDWPPELVRVLPCF